MHVSWLEYVAILLLGLVDVSNDINFADMFDERKGYFHDFANKNN